MIDSRTILVVVLLVVSRILSRKWWIGFWYDPPTLALDECAVCGQVYSINVIVSMQFNRWDQKQIKKWGIL